MNLSQCGDNYDSRVYSHYDSDYELGEYEKDPPMENPPMENPPMKKLPMKKLPMNKLPMDKRTIYRLLTRQQQKVVLECYKKNPLLGTRRNNPGWEGQLNSIVTQLNSIPGGFVVTMDHAETRFKNLRYRESILQ